MSIYCYRSKKGIVLLARGKEQCLYSAGNVIIGAPNADPELADLLHKPDHERLDDYVSSLYSNQDLFTANRDKLLLTRSSGNTHQTIKIFDSAGDSTVQGKINDDFSNGFDLSYYKTLEDMLFYVYKISGDRHPQFGFIDRYGAKLLFSPQVSLFLPPSEYTKRGELNLKKYRVNNEFYALVRKALDERFVLEDQIKSLSYKKKFGWRGTNKKLRYLKQDTRDIITRLIDYSHGPLERFSIRGFIEEIDQYIGQTAYRPKKVWNLQQAMDRELQPRDIRNLIMNLNIPEHHKKAGEIVASIERETGCKVHPLLNFSYMVIEGSVRDIKSIHKHARSSKFSNPYMLHIADIMYSHGVYYPELIHSFSKGSSYGIIPIGVTNKETLWNLVNIRSDEANKVTEGSGVGVAVIDTGVDYLHHQLAKNFGSVKGIDIVAGNNKPLDRNGHGTHVAGTIAGTSTGVAPQCRLYGVRVLDENGSGTLSNVLRGIDWCITNNVDVANLSLGSPSSSRIEKMVYDRAMEHGLVCIAAAGNEGYGASYPAAYDSVIAVAAVDRANEHAPFSNIYHTNNVSAPGVSIFSTLPNGEFGVLNGTSMATPHITGVASLVASQSGISKDSFQMCLEKSAKEIGNPRESNNWAIYGCGLVQADKALQVNKWKKSA